MALVSRRAVLAAPLLFAAAPAAAEPLTVLAAEPLTVSSLMRLLAAVPERRAPFREQKRLAALDAPLESTGHLLYRRPAYLEKVTDWPQPERLVVDGSRLILTLGNDPPRVVDLSGQPELRAMIDAMRAPLAGDLAVLQRAFTLRVGGTEADWTLDLTPSDPAAARMLRGVHITGSGGTPREVLVRQANGDEQRLLIGPPS